MDEAPQCGWDRSKSVAPVAVKTEVRSPARAAADEADETIAKASVSRHRRRWMPRDQQISVVKH